MGKYEDRERMEAERQFSLRIDQIGDVADKLLLLSAGNGFNTQTEADRVVAIARQCREAARAGAEALGRMQCRDVYRGSAVDGSLQGNLKKEANNA